MCLYSCDVHSLNIYKIFYYMVSWACLNFICSLSWNLFIMTTSSNNSAHIVTDNLNTSTQSLLTINMLNVTKFTSSNYLMWSLQIHALLDSYDLVGHLDGSLTVASATLTTEDQISVNQAYTLWKRHDKLIYSALTCAISIFPPSACLSCN